MIELCLNVDEWIIAMNKHSNCGGDLDLKTGHVWLVDTINLG